MAAVLNNTPIHFLTLKYVNEMKKHLKTLRLPFCFQQKSNNKNIKVAILFLTEKQ